MRPFLMRRLCCALLLVQLGAPPVEAAALAPAAAADADLLGDAAIPSALAFDQRNARALDEAEPGSGEEGSGSGPADPPAPPTPPPPPATPPPPAAPPPSPAAPPVVVGSPPPLAPLEPGSERVTTYTAVVSLFAAGEVGDYGAAERDAIAAAFAAAAATRIERVTVAVVAASVRLDVAVAADDAADAGRLVASLGAAAGTAAAAEALISAHGATVALTATPVLAVRAAAAAVRSDAAVGGAGRDAALVHWWATGADYLLEETRVHFTAWGAGLPAYLASPAAAWLYLLLGLLCCVLPYICFQNHWLPHCAGRIVGRACFRPCLPCTIYSNKVEFKGRWWAYVQNGPAPVILGQAPLFKSQLSELEQLGVNAIVNLCDEYKGKAAEYRKQGVSLLWLRTVDHLEPTVEAMRTAVSFIEHHRKRGSGVYIHCKSGRGRSAAIAMAWLLEVKRMTPLAANQHLLASRKVRAKLFLQKNIIQFYEELKGSRAAAASGDGQAALLGGGTAPRTMSFATVGGWSANNRRNSAAAARDVLFGQGTFKAAFTPRDSYAIDSAPPDWDQAPHDGVWEVNVAPLYAGIPEELPQWAQQQQAQFEQAPPAAPQLQMHRFGQPPPQQPVYQQPYQQPYQQQPAKQPPAHNPFMSPDPWGGAPMPPMPPPPHAASTISPRDNVLVSTNL
jgi:atypical dual specificity phosphatase